ncbi:hypothetical protein K3V98_14765, partial [Listeria monocytogenes]|nr:hypothetical protein [Listeria monocytogenes]
VPPCPTGPCSGLPDRLVANAGCSGSTVAGEPVTAAGPGAPGLAGAGGQAGPNWRTTGASGNLGWN